MSVGSHQWQEVARYGFGQHKDVCRMCGAIRHYSRMEGWPGWYDYFASAGNRVEDEPACDNGPLFRIGSSDGTT